MSEIKIVAFMQNPWFPEGTQKHHLDRYTTDQEFHRRVLANTVSGRRLLESFGHPFFDRIWWDNVCPKATHRPDGQGTVDMMHVERVISEQDPDLILTFGTLASEALQRSAGAIRRKVMHCHHPNARHRTQREMSDFAITVMQWVREQEILKMDVADES